MAGTIPGFGPLFAHRDDGQPAASARLYVYEANSSTLASIYSDSDLTASIANPIVATAFGFIDQFWVADGNYRCRLVLSVSDGGTVLADAPSIAAIGASSGGGGGGGSTPDTWETGDVIIYFGTTRSGWVRCNGRTIGSATSGATERANSDCQSLFTFLWDNMGDFVCPVSGGRGASAAADWAANKPIALPDLRGRAIFGLDGMGNTVASRITAALIDAGGGDTLGSYGGTQVVGLSEAQLPVVTPAGTVTTTITTNMAGNSFPVSVAQPGFAAGGDTSKFMGQSQITATISAASTFAGTSFGGGQNHSNMPPFMLATYLMRL